MSHLFFFGTLMDFDVVEIVLGRRFTEDEFISGTLRGYARRKALNEGYPVLVPELDGEVDVVVIGNITEVEKARLAFFESNEYEYRPFNIETGSGIVSAEGFASLDHFDASEEHWHLSLWQATEKPQFLVTAKVLMDYFGKLPVEEVDAMWESIKDEGRRIFQEAGHEHLLRRRTG